MIEITHLCRVYGSLVAVNDVSLTIADGEIVAIVGTSGSGKTTLMRMINRLVEPSSGSIKIDGRDNREIPAEELRRGIGYAIQGHGLFPHKTVGENIATVPKLLKWDANRIKARVDELLKIFNLDPAIFRERMPHELSGGQQQRVGVARALAAEPPILLMDEPFGALDPIIRDKAQADLLEIQRRYGTTVVIVTHDMDEAMRLGTRIAVMDKGQLQQFATPAEIIAHPATPFVRELLESGDRALRLLSLRDVAELIEPGDAEGNPIDAATSLRSALAECLWSGRETLPITSEGRLIGRIRRSEIERAARFDNFEGAQR
ncbi:ABC transporter ATP-binding protein [Paracoccus aminophilus]|uniref:Osmoprotectant transport system, ATP-binding protein n=1 Tax=Paracoccus aminophilus JCM 7686 TaxID=1367847 RepID=S5YBM2_PARAH|nr:ABC transporter ATP-binding protein [Paracoccus aminophilus]AGT08853.1 osmoprotectant transport system, ATP-binding protein [Paracoccus aminophilus JCM 7686]